MLTKSRTLTFLRFLTTSVDYFLRLLGGEMKENLQRSLLSKIKWIIKLPDGNLCYLRPFVKGDIEAMVEIYYEGSYDVIESLVKRGIIIDAGAHIGLFSTKMARLVGNKGAIIAIEPHPSNFLLLMKNLRANKCDNVTPLNVALSDNCGYVKLYLSPYSTSHSVIRRSDRWINVQSKTIDEIIRDYPAENVKMIKMDIEGVEFRALKGTQRLLRKAENIILFIEVHYTLDDVRPIKEFLMERGFDVRIIYRRYSSKPYILAAKTVD